MTRGYWLAIGLGVIAAIGATVWFVTRTPDAVMWQGYAEADFVLVGPTQQGLLTKLTVQRGDAVTAGDVLFEQDDIYDMAARDQAAQMLAAAQAQLANLLSGDKTTEIAQARANLADAQATLTRTGLDLKRDETLLPEHAISRQTTDQARADYLSAQAKVAAMQSVLQQSQNPLGRVQEVVQQRATIQADAAALTMAQWRLDQRHITAPTAGRIADVLAQPGETMAAGAPVVSLLPPGNIFVRFFVPESDASSLHLGDGVALACDGCANNLTAKISFISPKAEYTPPLIYSESSSSKLVFLIEARPPAHQATALNPGEPVEVKPIPARTP